MINIYSFSIRCTVIFLIPFFFSCKSSVYDETIVIEKGQWLIDNPITFSFIVDDTSKLYNIFLDVDHNSDYGYQNFYCLVESYAPGGLAQQQQNAVELATRKGKWKGNCNSATCISHIPFITKTKFDVPGPYKIIFTQFTRNNPLKGINSLRLTINEYI
ncbi:gliding motility lipoprotein GldH [Aureispira]|nr:gliding motility lipoprotein GldH [Aureispira sp.]